MACPCLPEPSGVCARKENYLTDQHRRNYLSICTIGIFEFEWSKKYEYFTVGNWMNVFFSDESKFVRMHSSGRVYVRCMTGEQYLIKCTRPTVQMGSDSLMIWGCFSWYGVEPMIELEGRINASRYDQFIRNTVSPYIKEKMGRKGIFQQDNAPVHIAKCVSKIFYNLKMKMLNWLAQSPDLYPIENIWRKTKVNLIGRNPKNKNNLKLHLNECYNSIDRNFCHNLTKSMPKRCKAIIKKFGYSTKY